MFSRGPKTAHVLGSRATEDGKPRAEGSQPCPGRPPTPQRNLLPHLPERGTADRRTRSHQCRRTAWARPTAGCGTHSPQQPAPAPSSILALCPQPERGVGAFIFSGQVSPPGDSRTLHGAGGGEDLRSRVAGVAGYMRPDSRGAGHFAPSEDMGLTIRQDLCTPPSLQSHGVHSPAFPSSRPSGPA